MALEQAAEITPSASHDDPHTAMKALIDDKARRSGQIRGAAGMWHTAAMAPAPELSSPMAQQEVPVEEVTDKRPRGAKVTTLTHSTRRSQPQS